MIPPGYWQAAHELGLATYRNRSTADVDEQAGPAYFEGLALSRWLFWQRLKWAARQVDNLRGQAALDFGCGFGLMLPLLRERFGQTYAVDLMPELSTEFVERWDNRSGGHSSRLCSDQLRIAASIHSAAIAPRSLDLVLALDVLEHFLELPEIVEQLHALLKPGGILLVTGPTENWLYKLGRRVVGFSGDYHHQSIYDIETALKPRFSILSRNQLPIGLPLFLMLNARNQQTA